jgi:hypothetical protein
LNEVLLWNIPLGALEFFVQCELHLPAQFVVPANYAVFDVVGAPATLFNFNLDGLASTFCARNHIVLEPHGRIDHLWFEAGSYEFWREAVTAFDVRLPHITPKLLPSPEPSEIVQKPVYEIAQQLFSCSPAMVIVGYSFGKTDGGFDDSASWRFFVDLLKAHPRPTFVLSPFPEELADMLRQSVSSDCVVGVPVYWETLAMRIIAATGRSRRLNSAWPDQQLRDFIYDYQRALEQ